MRHTSIKVANKCLITTLLLILGVVSTHAQYYMNIRQTNGTRLRYAVSAIDSVWFDNDEQQEPFSNYKYVDLGLSVKWATCNIGAEEPEDYGYYYAWGETEANKVDYLWSTYKYCNGHYDGMTKYNTMNNLGTIDNKRTLDESDDVAHIEWGGNWRMPTKSEACELIDSCTWIRTSRRGVDGYEITSNKLGYTDRSIFLPTAGSRYGLYVSHAGEYGTYWTSSLHTGYPNCAWSLYTNSNNPTIAYSDRQYGLPIRPVCP